MARDFARKFYSSKAWLECRASYIASVSGLCEECLKHNRIVPGYICHHTIWLTPNNINDPCITLNHEYLRFECLDCHNRTHSKHIEGMTRDGLRFNEFGDLVEIK